MDIQTLMEKENWKEKLALSDWIEVGCLQDTVRFIETVVIPQAQREVLTQLTAMERWPIVDLDGDSDEWDGYNSAASDANYCVRKLLEELKQ